MKTAGTSDTTAERFSDKTYVMPFGRYVGASDVGPPADEVLVGREGERAYLIDLLISTGKRGAYLVTGHRGAGKTSFVQHCIAEYESRVFTRFLRANVGKGFWDRLLMLALWPTMLVAALIVSELSQHFLDSDDMKNSLLRWVIVVPVVIALLYPCVYAKVVFETIFSRWFEPIPAGREVKVGQSARSRESRFAGVVATVLVVLLACWLSRLLGTAAVDPVRVAVFIPLICGVFLAVQVLASKPSRESNRQPGPSVPGLFGGLVLLGLGFWAPVHERTTASGADFFWLCAMSGCMLLGGALIHRAAAQSRFGSSNKDTALQRSVDEAVESGGYWYWMVGCALLLLGVSLLALRLEFLYFGLLKPRAWIVPCLEIQTEPLLVTGAIVLGALILLATPWLWQKSDHRRFQPRPNLILIVKALLSIVVALQLAEPLLEQVPLPSALTVLWEGYSHPGGSFLTRAQEFYWLLSLVTLTAIISFVEYEWILRPYLRYREDRHIDPEVQPAPWDEWDREPSADPPATTKLDKEYREADLLRLAQLTCPWVGYKTWTPVLPVAVNLGFDRLGHRQVIQAMLVGLRDRYHRAFLAWNSGFANFGRLVGFLLLLACVTAAGRRTPNDDTDRLRTKTWYQVLRVTLYAPHTGAVSEVGSKVPSTDDDAATNKTTIGLSSGQRKPSPLLFWAFVPSIEGQGRIRIRVYDCILLFLFFILGRRLLLAIPVVPYKRNLRRIDDLLDSMSTRLKTTSRPQLWGPARWIHSSMFAVRETEREPLDPRTIELAFLQILEDIQKGGFRFPGAARDHLTVPAPEITFLFDELDKLGARVDPEDLNIEPGAQERELAAISTERERSRRLRVLLSDLKNVLSSAPARFIFVGGRDLHDEWLADQTSRQPLLTSIFNAEVYLRSLMLDHDDCQRKGGEPNPRTLDSRIRHYLENQYRRAEILHKRSLRKRLQPAFALAPEAIAHDTFAPDRPQALPKLIDCSTVEAIEKGEGDALKQAFVRFLTHRSMGNPKTLKELLASFVRPASREILDAGKRWQQVPCRHVLKFGETEIFRIQLLSTIYRHLALAFEKRMIERDDKFAVSIFFLTDFIFKFHRRAFSWGNLERVDDLANIHRLPDLRDIQEEIVDHFSERFLHRVLNGMYAFRFRSDVTREVEYLSRKSPPEMAAFNFTLDESQSLKATYQHALKREKNPDLLAGLGELFEFDHEFERARHCYSEAIVLLDKRLLRQAAGQTDLGGRGQILKNISAILAGMDVGMETARLFLTWGEARLHLMLQIGMTYEHVRDLERAEVEYRSARTLARSLVRACVGPDTAESNTKHRWGRLHTLKQMNVVFQPMFASAWVAEKSIGAIDTSTSLVERTLLEIRGKLPFVKETPTKVDKDPAIPSHSNFALTMSQLHNKAGDLYFFKGRQPVPPDLLHEVVASASLREKRDRKTDGYLLRAHYHYAVALHELRRYLWHRVASSGHFLSLASSEAVRDPKNLREPNELRESSEPKELTETNAVKEPIEPQPTFIPGAWPDFFFRAVGGTVNDMAEATLGRISFFGLLRVANNEARAGAGRPGPLEHLESECTEWLAKDDSNTKVSEGEKDLLDLPNWFGEWAAVKAGSEEPWRPFVAQGAASAARGVVARGPARLITFDQPSSERERLEMSLRLCLTGANYFEHGGYPEDAAREQLQVCETVTRYLWWGRAIERIGALATDTNRPCEPIKNWIAGGEPASWTDLVQCAVFEREGEKEFWNKLFDCALQALRNADRLFRQSRFIVQTAGGGSSYLVGDIIPPEALTLLVSLRLAADPGEGASAILKTDKLLELDQLLASWIGKEKPSEPFQIATLTAWLEGSLRRHRYPMINRLNGIKLLIDHRLASVHLSRKELREAIRWTEELLDLNTEFDAPLHFTPLHSGLTCALLWLHCVVESGGSSPERGDASSSRPGGSFQISEEEKERIYRAAERDLRVSEEMYTMRRAYHEAISDLYYLYDDFNDRQIHFNHAIQMAGAELTSLFRELLACRSGKRDRPRKVPLVDKPLEPSPSPI